MVAIAAILVPAGPLKGGGADALASAGKPPPQPIVVTSRWGEYQPTCGPRQIGRRLQGFSRALRTVDADALSRYWGQGFVAFGIAVPGTVTRAFESYEDGLRFLRRQGGLRVRFKELQLNGSGGFGLDGAFRSRETGRKVLHGKAEFSCRRPSLDHGRLDRDNPSAGCRPLPRAERARAAERDDRL